MTEVRPSLDQNHEKKPIRKIVYGALGSVAMTAVQLTASFTSASGGGHNVLRTLSVENIDGMLYLGSARAAQLAQKGHLPEAERQKRVRRWRAGTLSLICAGALYTGYEAAEDVLEGDFHPATPLSIGLVAAGVGVNRLVERGLHDHVDSQDAHRDAWRHAMTDMAVGIGMGVALGVNYVTYKYGVETGWTQALPDVSATLGSAAIVVANAPTANRLSQADPQPERLDDMA